MTRTFGRHGRGHSDVTDADIQTLWTRTIGRLGHGHSDVTDTLKSWAHTVRQYGHGHFGHY